MKCAISKTASASFRSEQKPHTNQHTGPGEAMGKGAMMTSSSTCCATPGSHRQRPTGQPSLLYVGSDSSQGLPTRIILDHEIPIIISSSPGGSTVQPRLRTSGLYITCCYDLHFLEGTVKHQKRPLCFHWYLRSYLESRGWNRITLFPPNSLSVYV